MKSKVTNILSLIILLCVCQLKLNAQLMGAEQNPDKSVTIMFANGNITTNSNGSYTTTGNGTCTSCTNTLPNVTVYSYKNSDNTYTSTSYNYNGQFYQIPPPASPPPPPTSNTYSLAINSSNTSHPPPAPAPAIPNPCNGRKIATSSGDPANVNNPAYSSQVNQLKSYAKSSSVTNEYSSIIGINMSTGVCSATTPAMGTPQSTAPTPINQNNTTSYGMIHTHPAAAYPTPSAGDIYALATANAQSSSYTTSYVLASDGSTYALVVTNGSKTAAFMNSYPYATTIDQSHKDAWAPTSPMMNDYNAIDAQVNPGGGAGALDVQSFEESQAYILDTYNTGITLFKADASGTFKEVHTIKASIQSGQPPKYSQYNCL